VSAGAATVYGVLGVGSLGHAIVTGLVGDAVDPPKVVLSPRGEARAAELATAYGSVSVAADNQGVVDAADVVVVCLRAVDAGLLPDLAWREEQVVVSAVAGLGAPGLRDAVAPARHVARAVPMVGVATRTWATPVRPPLPEAMSLFERTGGAIPIETDEQFDAIYTGLGTVAPFFEYLAAVEGFLADHGLPVDDARRLLASSFSTVGDQLAAEGADFEAMVAAHAPPGGGNEQLTTLMRQAGVFDATRRSLDEVYRRQTRRD
jgi:pyrroline-5-carboxylate reductase